MPKILLCTVGTSMLGNFRNVRNADELAVELRAKQPNQRECGAEINSITLMKRYFDPTENTDRIVFLCSDTDDGILVGNALRLYYGDNAEVKRVEGLKPEAKEFRSKGLGNLVRIMAQYKCDNPNAEILINATGGYKAQISFAGLIGQVLDIPVFYRFEQFDEVIQLMPLPVEFDFNFWLENYTIFDDLSRQSVVSIRDYPQLENWNSVLLERDEHDYVMLSAIGVLFHEGFRNRIYRQAAKSLFPPSRDNDQESFVFEDNNPQRIDGLQQLFRRIWRECRYVTRLRSQRYSRHPIGSAQFKKNAEQNVITARMNQANGDGMVEFWIYLKPCSETQRSMAIADLTNRFAAAEI